MSLLELSRGKNKKTEDKQLPLIGVSHKSCISHPSEQNIAIETSSIDAEETRIGRVLCGHVHI